MYKTKADTSYYYLSKLNNLQKPTILELGVNNGWSTINFLKHITQFGGELFSIDIKDCSKTINNKVTSEINLVNWNFLQSNDLNIKYILKNFPKLNEGIDLLFVDSYHDETHVKKILETWFLYVKKNGFIYFDDTESILYRKKKNFTLSVCNDSIDKYVYNFYCNNLEQIDYIKYFKGSGMSEFKKLSPKGTAANFSGKTWRYSLVLSKIYLFLKKLIYKIKSKDKK